MMEVRMFLFGKKKKTLEKPEIQDGAVIERAPRYKSLASISINGFDGEALLKNISITGFCMESKTFVNITPGTTYGMHIVPEVSTSLEQFDVEVEARWVLSEVFRFDVGFLLTKTQSRKDMDRYIEFLKQKGAPAS
jgi:hypothetical protein